MTGKPYQIRAKTALPEVAAVVVAVLERLAELAAMAAMETNLVHTSTVSLPLPGRSREVLEAKVVPQRRQEVEKAETDRTVTEPSQVLALHILAGTVLLSAAVVAVGVPTAS